MQFLSLDNSDNVVEVFKPKPFVVEKLPIGTAGTDSDGQCRYGLYTETESVLYVSIRTKSFKRCIKETGLLHALKGQIDVSRHVLGDD